MLFDSYYIVILSLFKYMLTFNMSNELMYFTSKFVFFLNLFLFLHVQFVGLKKITIYSNIFQQFVL